MRSQGNLDGLNGEHFDRPVPAKTSITDPEEQCTNKPSRAIELRPSIIGTSCAFPLFDRAAKVNLTRTEYSYLRRESSAVESG